MRPDLPEACLGVVRHCSQHPVKALQHSQAPCHMAPDLCYKAFTEGWEQLYAHVHTVHQSRGIGAATKTVVSLWLSACAEHLLHASSTANTEIQLCVLFGESINSCISV